MSGADPKERIVDYAFRMGWAMTRHTPEPVAERLLEGVADRLCRQRGEGVQRLERNLARAAPDADDEALRTLTNEAMRSYFRYWHEAFRLPAWNSARIVDGVVTVDEDRLRDAYAEGRGVIVALPHMANWDLAGAWACLTGMPVSTVAERLRPESLYRRFVGYREQLGMEVAPLSGGTSPMAAMREALGRARLVCLLADRDLSGTGIEVELLGERARLPSGPATLARVTGAPLLAITLHYTGPLMRIEFSRPVTSVGRGATAVTAMTQQVADHFTAGIRSSPQDWHMLQRVFSADLEPARQ